MHILLYGFISDGGVFDPRTMRKDPDEKLFQKKHYPIKSFMVSIFWLYKFSVIMAYVNRNLNIYSMH